MHHCVDPIGERCFHILHDAVSSLPIAATQVIDCGLEGIQIGGPGVETRLFCSTQKLPYLVRSVDRTGAGIRLHVMLDAIQIIEIVHH